MAVLSIKLALFVAVVRAIQAPVGTPFRLQFGTSGFCISASANADGAPVNLVECATANTIPASAIWTADRGGAASGDGPATQIRAYNGTKCLDVTNGVDENGTKLQVWTCTNLNSNQFWTIDDDLSIVWAGRQKAVDLTDGNPNTPQLQIWDRIAGNTHQKWTPEPLLIIGTPPTTVPPNGAVNFQITSTAAPPSISSGCLTASSNADGAPVTFEQCTANNFAQDWAIVEGGGGPGAGPTTQIQVFGNKCLDVKDGLDQNGTKLQIWTCALGNTNQLFNVNGDKSIGWSGKGKCVDLTDGKHTAGNVIQVWSCITGSTNQAWTAEQLP